jgi:hypothetical protein
MTCSLKHPPLVEETRPLYSLKETEDRVVKLEKLYGRTLEMQRDLFLFVCAFGVVFLVTGGLWLYMWNGESNKTDMMLEFLETVISATNDLRLRVDRLDKVVDHLSEQCQHDSSTRPFTVTDFLPWG